MFPKSPKYAEQIEILTVCEKSVATRWRMQHAANVVETEAMKISVNLTVPLEFETAWSPSYCSVIV